jgi:hypothetical protein
MDIQTTQMINAPALKKTSVNQSMNALTLSLSVGNANAAREAIAGKPSNNARSLKPDSHVEQIATVTNQSGKER